MISYGILEAWLVAFFTLAILSFLIDDECPLGISICFCLFLLRSILEPDLS